MNKKFLSAILFGAMLVTAIGTFVSCKDYDDDIENLQSQIDGLSTSSSSLSSSLSSVQSSLESELSSIQSTMQSQIDDAQTKLQSAIDNKADAEEISTLAGNVATLKENYEATVATLTTQIEAAETSIKALQEAGSNEEALQSAIDDANAVLAALTGTDPGDDAATAAAVAANMKIQLDAVVAFQEAVESADYQTQIDALKEYIEGSDDSASLTQQIEDVKAELEAAIASNTTDINELKTTVQTINDALLDINPNLDALTLLVKNGVTSIELVYSYNHQADSFVDDGEGGSNYVYNTDLGITVATEQDNVFEDNNLDKWTIKNQITFTKGNLYQVPAELVVRVSPVNADLAPEMIQFVNSQGGTLDGIVEVKKVEKYNTLLTKAAAATGLWTVYVQLVDQTTEKQMEAVTQTKVNNVTKNILFAIQVNNTPDSDETRYATSSYDLTMNWVDYVPATELDYFVGDYNVSTQLVNRYANNGDNPSLPNTPDLQPDYTEWTWLGDPAVEPITSGSKANVEEDINDDRSTSDYVLYPAVMGEPITIALTTSTSKVVAPTNIRAIYVTLDMNANAIESAPSEWNAWNSYEYEGLNTVVEGTTTTITIKNINGVNSDIIGFRVYAVNYDGTLVDPDGKAFYVAVGDTAIDWNAAATTITPEGQAITDTESEPVSVSLSKLTADHVTWTTDAITVSGTKYSPIFNAAFYNGKTEVFNTADENWEDVALDTDLSKITSVTTTISPDDAFNNPDSGIYPWTYYEDNKAYTGTLTFYDEYDHVLATIKVTMTKVLPTDMPDGFSIKTNQVTNGIYYGFLVPSDDSGTESWASESAEYGSMGMDEIFNFGTTDEDVLGNYIISWGTSAAKNGKYTEPQELDGTETLVVPAELVDNETYHETTVSYDYGYISSVKNSKGAYEETIITGETFQSIYVSIYYEKAYTWSWATDADLLKAGYKFTYDDDGNVTTVEDAQGNDITSTYPLSTELIYGNSGQTVDAHYIFGTSLKDSRYNATGLNDVYENSLSNYSAKLTSNSNGNEEYFTVNISNSSATIEFVPTESQNTNPVGDVASTLTITCYDSYGNEVTIELPMTVKERK